MPRSRRHPQFSERALAAALAEAGIGYTHVPELGGMREPRPMGAFRKDPDGIEFEIAWVIPKDLLDDDALEARKTIAHLDLAKEKARYGADTQGGVGISR